MRRLTRRFEHFGPRLEMLERRDLLTAVAGVHLFYNGSSFDGNDTAINAADDDAIAPDKSAFFSEVLFDVEQLTTNATLDSEPRVYGNKIVWQGRGGTDGGSDDEIFYFDGTTVIQLTENTVPDRFPEISALGIAWERGTGTGQEIIFWNGSETPLTDNSVFDGNASLSDNRLSWEQGSGTGLEIWSWDGVNPPANISNNSVVDVKPHTNAGNTVWVTDSVPNRKVLQSDGTNISIIGTSNLSIDDPRIDGVDVVWEGFKGTMTTDREIYHYNGNIVQRLTTNSFSDFDPQVSDGHVTWWGGVFNDFQISLFDGSTVREISTGIRNQYPQIDGQHVVWYGYDGQDDEIFLWDGIKVTQLTDNETNDTNPQISGNHIVWQGIAASSGNTQEIFHTYIDQERATEANVSSYSRGINGIMIDLADLPGETVLTADDFKFKIGANNAPGTWTDAPAPSAISLRPGAGEGGSDRLTITWPNGAITNTWLQVVVEGNDDAGSFNTNTGLATSSIFYFGSRLGDTFANEPPTLFVTNVNDEISARNNVAANQPIDSALDFDRNGLVNVADQIVARNNIGLLNKLYLGNGLPIPEPLVASLTQPAGLDPGVAYGLASKRFETVFDQESPQNPPASVQRAQVAWNRLAERIDYLAYWIQAHREKLEEFTEDATDALDSLSEELLDLLARRRR